MPLTKHGRKMQRAFMNTYGIKRGTQVFYATANSRQQGGKGKIGGKKIDRSRRR